MYFMKNNNGHVQKQYLNVIFILALSSFLCGSLAILAAAEALILSPFISVMLYIACLFSPPIIAYFMLKKYSNHAYVKSFIKNIPNTLFTLETDQQHRRKNNASVEQQMENLQPSHQWLYHTYSTARKTI